MNIKQLAETIFFFFLNQYPGVLWSTLSRVWFFFSFFFPHVYLAESVSRIVEYIKLTGTHKDHWVLKLNHMTKSIIQMHLNDYENIEFSWPSHTRTWAGAGCRHPIYVCTIHSIRKTSFWALLLVVQQTSSEPWILQNVFNCSDEKGFSAHCIFLFIQNK